MNVQVRPYHHDQDYDRISDFLIENFQPGNNHYLWLQPRWEYMHFHPLIKKTELSKIGVAEIAGRIAGVVHHEHDEGEIYFQIPPENAFLTPALLDYAEATYGRDRQKLKLQVNEANDALRELAAGQGYREVYRVTTSRYDLEHGVPMPVLPAGFHLQSLAEENDLHKMNQVLWRGFNHPGPPPEDEIPGRRFMQSAPNFRHDLTVVAVAPNGDFASYCGMWVVPENGFSYVEPVATDPTYRRLGLGKAVVLEGIRRTIPFGARTAWVGSDMNFYLNLGFVPSFSDIVYEKWRINRQGQSCRVKM